MSYLSYDSKLSFTSAVPVSPNDTQDLTAVSRAVFIGSSGALTVNMLDGAKVTFNGLVGGQVLFIGASRVYATGTTATGIVAFY